MSENNSSSTPTSTDLMGWADEYAQTFPVVSDTSWQVFNQVWGGGGIPSFALVAPGGRLVTTSSPSTAEIEAVLPM